MNSAAGDCSSAGNTRGLIEAQSRVAASHISTWVFRGAPWRQSSRSRLAATTAVGAGAYLASQHDGRGVRCGAHGSCMKPAVLDGYMDDGVVVLDSVCNWRSD